MREWSSKQHSYFQKLKKISEHIHSDEKVSKATKFLKIRDSFFYSIFDINEMTRTRGGLARRINNFDKRRFAAAKEIVDR